MDQETQETLSCHRQEWESEMEAMCDLMREEWQEAHDKRCQEVNEQFEKEKLQAIADVEKELEAKGREEDLKARQAYWRLHFKHVQTAEEEGRSAILAAVDQEKQRSIGRLCYAARELRDITKKCHNHVLTRMQKGSYFADEEYNRILKWDTRLSRAQETHHQLVLDLVDAIAEYAVCSHTLIPTHDTIR